MTYEDYGKAFWGFAPSCKEKSLGARAHFDLTFGRRIESRPDGSQADTPVACAIAYFCRFRRDITRCRLEPVERSRGSDARTVILPDVNILVHAFRQDSSEHHLCRSWLGAVVNGESRYAIAPQVLSGFIRVVTHARIFAKPSKLNEAIAFCQSLIGQPQCVLIQPGPQHWQIFLRLCEEAGARGNLIADAWNAALAIESGCEWITLDRDYARFAGLKWQVPKPAS